MTRLTRKEIKQDDFRAAVGRSVEYAEGHVRLIIYAVGGVLVAPGEEKDKGDPDAYRAVGDVKRRKADFTAAAWLKIEPQKVHDMLADEAIDEVSHDTADDEAESELSEDCV